jgi:hypothetical protein
MLAIRPSARILAICAGVTERMCSMRSRSFGLWGKDSNALRMRSSVADPIDFAATCHPSLCAAAKICSSSACESRISRPVSKSTKTLSPATRTCGLTCWPGRYAAYHLPYGVTSGLSTGRYASTRSGSRPA